MKQNNGCSKIRRLLAERFSGVLFKVTSSKHSQNVNNISIVFPNRNVLAVDVVSYLRDNGYDQFIIVPVTTPSGRLYTTVITGYVSECNYSLAVFA